MKDYVVEAKATGESSIEWLMQCRHFNCRQNDNSAKCVDKPDAAATSSETGAMGTAGIESVLDE